MENKFNAHIYLIKEGEQIYCFSLSFKNRLMVGDLITVDELISGEIASRQEIYNLGYDAMYKSRESTVAKLKKLGIKVKHITEVTKVYVHPIVNYASVDFSADVSILSNIGNKL